MTVVLDTSAVLALLWAEPGADRVYDVLSGSTMSAVNLAELVAKLIDRGADDADAVGLVAGLGIETVGFDAEQAVGAGLLRRTTKVHGLSIGDRACLGLARRSGARAMTADRVWALTDLGVEIDLIR